MRGTFISIHVFTEEEITIVVFVSLAWILSHGVKLAYKDEFDNEALFMLIWDALLLYVLIVYIIPMSTLTP